MSLFIGVISENTKIPALLQIIDSGTVIGKAVAFHGSGNIPLCRLFRFCQRFVLQSFIEAVFNVVIDHHLIPRFQVFRFHHRFGNREAIFRNKLGNTALYLCPRKFHAFGTSGTNKEQAFGIAAAVFTAKPCGSFFLPRMVFHIFDNGTFAVLVSVPCTERIINIILCQRTEQIMES